MLAIAFEKTTHEPHNYVPWKERSVIRDRVNVVRRNYHQASVSLMVNTATGRHAEDAAQL
jgi:hypothetical protein